MKTYIFNQNLANIRNQSHCNGTEGTGLELHFNATTALFLCLVPAVFHKAKLSDIYFMETISLLCNRGSVPVLHGVIGGR